MPCWVSEEHYQLYLNCDSNMIDITINLDQKNHKAYLE